MSTNFRSLGVFGAGTRTQILRDEVVIRQEFVKDAAFLSLSLGEFNKESVPDGCALDILIKDGEHNERTYLTAGDIKILDLDNVRQPLPRKLDPRRSQIFIKVVDPDDARIVARSDVVRLSGGDAESGGRGNETNSKSPIHLHVEIGQILPWIPVIDDARPVISFSDNFDIKTPNEALFSLGAMAYALPFAIETFIRALLDDDGAQLASDSWNGLRAAIVKSSDHPTWDALVLHHSQTDKSIAARSITEAYFKDSPIAKRAAELFEIQDKAEEEEN